MSIHHDQNQPPLSSIYSTDLHKKASGAIFSPCERYRYMLWRKPIGVELHQCCAFIGLNPSTADEVNNDPTVTRCINFAHRWGYFGFVMLNLFAYRATDPNEMKRQTSPVGLWNNDALAFYVQQCGRTVAAWGNHGSHLNRSTQVRFILATYKLHHLGLNKDGSPKHPLYLKQSTEPQEWPCL